VQEALLQLRLITNNMAAGVTRCSRDLHYMWVSRGYAAWLRKTPGEIAGRPIVDVLGPDGFTAIQPYIEKVLSGERTEYETQVTFFGVGQRWIHAVYVPTRGRDHSVDGWIAVVADITERHEGEDKLRQSEERFRRMADASPVMIWMAGLDKRCTFFNKGWLNFTGRTMEQEQGNGWVSGVHPDDLDRCLEVYASSFDAQQDFSMEYRLRRADGAYRWILDRGTPQFTADGIFECYIGSCIDITDLKRTQEGALRTQKLESVSLLTAGIAHDFNNLLGSIVSQTEVALSDLPAGPRQEIETIRTLASRAAEIVRELMIYSGQETADFAPLDVSRLVEEMLELLKVSVSKHVNLKTNLAKNLPLVNGHAPQIRQIVMNLIVNASEAIGEEDGVIEVTTSRVTGGRDLAPDSAMELSEGDYVRLQISDTGCGMTAEQKVRAFDPFFTTKFAGRGLGLAVVQGVVRAHQGAIHLVSAPGEGTEFQILLPSLAGQPGARVEASGQISMPTAPVSSTPGNVLLVEDEGVLRQAIAKMLRKHQFSVLEATDGSAAIDLLRSRDDIDLILLDLTLPGISSREVFEQSCLRPGIKVILTSAYGPETVRTSLDVARAAGYIRKPFQFDELLRLVRESLSAKRAAGQ